MVVDAARVTETTIEFIDNTDGSIVDVPVQFNNNTPSEVVLSRPRPEAYVFSPGFSDVAERLRILGIEVEVIPERWTGTVETLLVNSVTLATSRHEGVVHAKVTTTPGSREVTFPPGAFRVSTRQKNAALAFIALEPENINSFVTYNVIPLEPRRRVSCFSGSFSGKPMQGAGTGDLASGSNGDVELARNRPFGFKSPVSTSSQYPHKPLEPFALPRPWYRIHSFKL